MSVLPHYRNRHKVGIKPTSALVSVEQSFDSPTNPAVLLVCRTLTAACGNAGKTESPAFGCPVSHVPYFLRHHIPPKVFPVTFVRSENSLSKPLSKTDFQARIPDHHAIHRRV
jgi:hypothetical protein